MTIAYAQETDLPVAEFRRLLDESGLGTTRPVDDPGRLGRMLEGAELVVTARRGGPGGELLGLARCVTDFAWICYLSELVVTRDAQGLGVGRGLLEATRGLVGPEVTLILSSMPDVTGFYERTGMARVQDVFWFRRTR